MAAQTPTLKLKFTYDLTPKDLVQKLIHADKSTDKYLKTYFRTLRTAGVGAALSASGPKYTGALARSLVRDSTSSEKGLTIGSHLSYAARVDGENEYSVPGLIEAKSWNDMVSLQEWVAKKIRPPDQDLTHVTYLIARKISRYGYKTKRHFMKAAEEKVKQNLSSAGRTLAEQLIRDLK